jgi:ectoine hydroxylase
VQDQLFPDTLIERLVQCVDGFALVDAPGHVRERDTGVFRAFHGCHLYSAEFDAITRCPELLTPTKTILEDDVYIHQVKVNLKQAFSGEMWPWHQDYIYWRNEDKIPTNRVVSVMIFLDDINEFNGPLFFIPGSHQQGCIEPKIEKNAPKGWQGNVSANLTYQVADRLVSQLVEQGGLFSAKGKKGTAVWFDGNLVHASPANISPMQRRILIVTYNAVSNVPLHSDHNQRPEFLNGRERSPLTESELSI